MTSPAFHDAYALGLSRLTRCVHPTLIQVFVAHEHIEGGRPVEFEYCQDCGAMRMNRPLARWFAPALVAMLADLAKLEQETPDARH